jgi:hypothetical protein
LIVLKKSHHLHNVWTDPDSYVRYVFICIEFVGSTTSGKINAAIVDDGNAVEVEVKISRGGKLTNPEHLLMMYGDQIDTDHPIYQAQMRIKGFTTDKNEERRVICIILPFTCSTAGFIDPLRGETDQETYDLGIFPLYNQSSSEDAPDPSTNFSICLAKRFINQKLNNLLAISVCLLKVQQEGSSQ